jgi:YHS domain-containing protein
MEGLLSFLLFAGLFYFMMRFGCGAHMVHGHGGHAPHDGHATDEPQARDPVCGRTVAPGQGYAKPYAGREYRFCSKACLDTFDAHPEQYVSGGTR